jgi:hypothetical protein
VKPSAAIGRQSVMDVRGSDGSMAKGHAQLMQVRHNVTSRVKALDCRSLVIINNEISTLGA